MKKILNFFINIFSPTFLVIYEIINVYQNRINKKTILKISLFIGVLGYLFTPYQLSDNARHFMNFHRYIREGFSNREYDYFLYFLIKNISRISSNFYWIQFIFSFLTYYLFLISFYNFTLLKKSNKKVYFLFFLQYFLFISFNDTVDGMRDYLSLAICYYAFSLIYLKKNKIKIIGILFIATLVHYMAYIYIIIYIFSKLKIITKYKYLYLLFSIILGIFFINPQNIYKIVEYINVSEHLKNRILIYFSEDFSESLKSARSIKGIIYDKLYFFINVVIPCLYYLYTYKIKNKIRNVVVINLILVYLFFNFYTISYRLSQIISLLTIFELFVNNLKNKKKWILLFLFTSIMFFSMNLYSYRIAYFEIIKYSFFNILLLPLRENFSREFLVK